VTAERSRTATETGDPVLAILWMIGEDLAVPNQRKEEKYSLPLLALFHTD
jgi:hypothetical protein